MKKKNIDDWSKEGKGKIIFGDFKNEYGERFILYYYDCLKHLPLITGDEFDWEDGWEVKKNGNVYTRFMLNSKEKSLVKKAFDINRL